MRIVRDHEFIGDDRRGAPCRARVTFGWIKNLACGYPRSRHRKRKPTTVPMPVDARAH